VCSFWGSLQPEGLHEGEHLVAHRLEHLLRGRLLEARPAEIVLVGGEDRLLDRLAGAGGLALLPRVQLIEPFDEQQVAELLEDRERIRDLERRLTARSRGDRGADAAPAMTS
jgi:hypothetical protein